MLSNLSLGIYNGWWFIAIILVINIVLMIIYPSHFSQRLFKLPDFKNEKLPGVLYAALLNLSMIYPIFCPLNIGAPLFFFGTVIFILGAILFIITMHNYATTPPDKPVVKGIYQFTRNPQQLLSVLMLLGIAAATDSLLLVISCILQLLLMYPTFVSQERFCVEKYGQEYSEYMKKVPRYFWKI